MFDIGFSELMVIAVIALVVIGPERLPRVARTLGHLAGRLQRYVSDVKADINREIELEELRKMRDSMQQAASSFETSVRSGLNAAESEVSKLTADAEQALKNEAKPVDQAAPTLPAAADPTPAAEAKPSEPKPT